MQLKGKPLSLGAKIIAVVIVLVGLAAKIFFAPDVPIDDVIKIALFIVLIFGPVDLSLVLENIFVKPGRVITTAMDDQPPPPGDAKGGA